MAERVILVDDLDGKSTEGVERIEFSWQGKDYEVDLSSAHIERYSDLLDPLLKAARLKQVTGRKTGRTAAGKSKADAAETKRIRDWGKTSGLDVPDRGPIPKEVRDAYAAAQASEEAAVPSQVQPGTPVSAGQS
ncbi:histone-like nucleoid-structuring protein Lsr2 [Streptomyces sp. MJM1172]|uniref:histone-like nucleoid-structuring protein Lsr2 n=1 Tax=Streptomyces sp. MJM1172 TaxID=1703926 RepID=UPI000939DEBA|nr:Lsr2 family protein [Streptomyces sp. MJM1172]OKI50340.1 hypothetical protein AMK15_32825 [Streptomyces sp. MJM1172]